jgi:hypothetical protein
MAAAKRQRRRHGELTLRRAILARGYMLGLIDLIENAAARLDISGAGIGQGNPAARPMEKPRVQVIFELREAPADRRERCAKTT